MLEAWCYVLLKTAVPSFLRYVAVRVLMSLSITLYFLKVINFDQFVIGLVVVYAIEVSILIVYLTYLKEFCISFQIRYFNLTFVKKILLYGMYTLASSSGFLIVTKIDNLMLAAMVGLKASGIYVTMVFIGVVIEMPKRSIRKIAGPIIAHMFAQKDIQGIRKFYQKISKYELLIGLLLFIGIYVNLDNLLTFIPNAKLYILGKPVVLLICLSKLIDMAFGINSTIVSLSAYFRFNIVAILFLGIITILTNYWMIPIFGMHGAAAATVISLFSYNFLILFFVFLKFKIQPFTTKTIQILAIGGITFYIACLIKPMFNTLYDICLRSLLIVGIYMGLVIFLKYLLKLIIWP